MENWIRDLFTFAFSVIFHWQALVTGGVVIAAVGVIERRKKHNLSWQSYAFILAAFLLYSVFAAWQDEHRNTSKVIEEKSGYASQASGCLADLKDSQRALHDKQVLADSLQAGIVSMQGPQSQQAANILSCIDTLAKMNPQIIRKTQVIPIRFMAFRPNNNLATPGTLITKWAWAFFIITNVPQSPPIHGFLKCDKDFTIIQSPQIFADTKLLHIVNPMPKAIKNNEYELRILDIDSVWNVSHPAFLQATSLDESIGNCSFSLAE